VDTNDDAVNWEGDTTPHPPRNSSRRSTTTTPGPDPKSLTRSSKQRPYQRSRDRIQGQFAIFGSSRCRSLDTARRRPKFWLNVVTSAPQKKKRYSMAGQPKSLDSSGWTAEPPIRLILRLIFASSPTNPSVLLSRVHLLDEQWILEAMTPCIRLSFLATMLGSRGFYVHQRYYPPQYRGIQSPGTTRNQHETTRTRTNSRKHKMSSP